MVMWNQPHLPICRLAGAFRECLRVRLEFRLLFR
jgi:hypothetical protein